MNTLHFRTKFLSDETGAISCTAWRYNQIDRVGDEIVKGAFGNIDLPVPMLGFHDQKAAVGSWTEAVDGDELQLKGHILIGKTALADEMHALVMGGALRAVSISFIPKKYERRKGGGIKVFEAELLETSLVAVGAHAGARITSAKSMVEAMKLAEIVNRATAHYQRT